MRFYILCLLASVAAGTSLLAGNVSSKAVVPDEQVQLWVRVWQKRLHLEDWNIETRIVRRSELKPETVGNLKWNSANRTAVVRVLSPLDYDMPALDVPEDMEYTVVHELIHLQLSVLPRDSNAKSTEEQVVNKIAEALMALDKGPLFRARSVPPARGQKAPDGANNEAAGRQGSRSATAAQPAATALK